MADIVYCLKHRRRDSGDVKYIGTYTTWDSARVYIEHLRTQVGFNAHHNDFYINEYEIDNCWWREGFRRPSNAAADAKNADIPAWAHAGALDTAQLDLRAADDAVKQYYGLSAVPSGPGSEIDRLLTSEPTNLIVAGQCRLEVCRLTDVFMAEHEREFPDDVKTIGFFSSLERAIDAVRALQDKPGFSEYPDGFDAGPVRLGRGGWEEGFISASEA